MVRRQMVKTLGVISLALSLSSLPIHASEVTDGVRSMVDDVIRVLRDETLKGPQKTEERRAKIREIVKRRFDFDEMAKLSLGKHWKERGEVEKKEFVNLFSRFVEISYIDKIEAYNNEEVIYIGELVEGKRAIVRSRVITTQGREIPISYRLLKKDGWVVYDLQIEGVSLVSNYRTQFNEIIQNFSYEELIKRLKSKLVPEDSKQGVEGR